jgi:crossover junction endodeoxyribonuclease RusA
VTDLYIVTVTGPRWLNANDRLHWAPKAKATKQWRDNAAWAVKAAHVPRVTGKAHITAVLLFPDRRRRDPANWYPTVKACIDGLVPGVLADDDVNHLSGPDMRSRVHPGLKVPTVELHITEVAP